jgi:hypothetical protein
MFLVLGEGLVGWELLGVSGPFLSLEAPARESQGFRLPAQVPATWLFAGWPLEPA